MARALAPILKLVSVTDPVHLRVRAFTGPALAPGLDALRSLSVVACALVLALAGMRLGF